MPSMTFVLPSAVSTKGPEVIRHSLTLSEQTISQELVDVFGPAFFLHGVVLCSPVLQEMAVFKAVTVDQHVFLQFV